MSSFIVNRERGILDGVKWGQERVFVGFGGRNYSIFYIDGKDPAERTLDAGRGKHG